MTTYVIQVAMDEEAAPFLEAAAEVSEPIRIGRAVHRGAVLGGRTVVVVVSGIGMVNAAVAAAGAVHRYGPEIALIVAGTAGGLAGMVEVGDVIVGVEAVNVDADARAFGYALGQTPGMPERYSADPDLREALTVGDAGASVRTGAMGSGEKFVTVELAHALRHDFPSLLSVDMETAAVAQAALNHGVRFAVARGVSDLCAPTPEQFETHVDDAAARSARVVIAALGRL
ncbi:5'-methylthioadenosine/S-adenosylhomocysteine nucleosidase [Microbacterium sp. Marseille-Q6965]|uniref:5'-methylthioadenosine/S-adenosylhomocysteine nucleosidase n=1 Tax=Microbacterium sp. Marseille-Q6965 TaxID=2965072 RepID=UPI0021B7A308|nr:5'-methylthioadenosine/S-adenosylhomocysteine nucleosidase [Microbacterium sp. Marseille-Q6965]